MLYRERTNNTKNLHFVKVYVDALQVPCNFSLFKGMTKST
jgi:hypothetical protein